LEWKKAMRRTVSVDKYEQDLSQFQEYGRFLEGIASINVSSRPVKGGRKRRRERIINCADKLVGLAEPATNCIWSYAPPPCPFYC
jgi:hypothetical protein